MIRAMLLILTCTFALIVSANAENKNSYNTLYVDVDEPLAPGQFGLPPKYYIGPVIGYNHSNHIIKKELNPAAIISYEQEFEHSFESGFFVGISLEYLLGDPANTNTSIIVRVVYNHLPAYFKESGDPYASRIEINGKEEIVIANTFHSMDVKYNLLSFETQFKLQLSDFFGILIGPTFDFALKRSYIYKYGLESDQDIEFKKMEHWEQYGIRYEDNGKTMVFNETEIPDASSFRLGLKAGIHYYIPIGKMFLVPTISYNYGATNLTSDFDWRVNSLQLGIDVLFSL